MPRSLLVVLVVSAVGCVAGGDGAVDVDRAASIAVPAVSTCETRCLATLTRCSIQCDGDGACIADCEFAYTDCIGLCRNP